jgi:phosphopantetheinyl transferase (holo-ACP synthase)
MCCREMEKQEVGEKLIMTAVIICNPHKVFVNKQVKGNEMSATRSTHDEEEKYANKFSAKPCRTETT